jgi:hypothetical protein
MKCKTGSFKEPSKIAQADSFEQKFLSLWCLNYLLCATHNTSRSPGLQKWGHEPSSNLESHKQMFAMFHNNSVNLLLLIIICVQETNCNFDIRTAKVSLTTLATLVWIFMLHVV